jgi:hypothetical protein
MTSLFPRSARLTLVLAPLAFLPGPVRAAVTFESPDEHAVGDDPHGLKTYDFNGDVWPDVVVANQASNSVSLFVNLSGDLTLFGEIPTGGAALSVASGDLDGDGVFDLVVGHSQGTSHGAVIRNVQHGALQSPVPFGSGGSANAIFVHDVDGDAHPDVLVVDPVSRAVHVYRNAGDGTLPDSDVYPVLQMSSYPLDACLADVNGDGNADVVVAAPLSSTPAVYLLGQPDGHFTGPFLLPTSAGASTSVAAGDLDGDEDTDLVVIEFGSAQELRVLLNLGGGQWSQTGFSPTGLSLGLQSRVRLADVDRDGAPDIVAIPRSAGFTPGLVAVLVNDGFGAFTATPPFSSGGYGTSLLLADLNGDVAPDLMVVDHVNEALWVLRNSTTTGVPGLPAPGAAGFRLAGRNPTPGGIEFALPEDADVRARIRIVDAAGRATRTLPLAGAATHARWDGRDARGRAVPAGVYFARLEGAREPVAVQKVVVVR